MVTRRQQSFAGTLQGLKIRKALMNHTRVVLEQKERFKRNVRFLAASHEEKERVRHDIVRSCRVLHFLEAFEEFSDLITDYCNAIAHCVSERVDLETVGPVLIEEEIVEMED
jgi:hypothetical protein